MRWSHPVRKRTGFVAAMGLAALLVGCTSPEERVAEHFADGQALLASGEVQKAALEFRNVLKIDEDHVGALYGISKYREQAQQWEALAATLHRVIDLDPGHVDAREDMCRLLLLGGAVERALERCDEAAKLDPGRASVIAVKAAIRHRMGENQAAAALAEEALAIDPTNIDATVVRASQSLASGRAEDAMALVERASEVHSENVALALFKVQVLNTLNRRDEAIEVLRGLVDRFPNSRAYRNALVRYHVIGGENDEAEALLRAAADSGNEAATEEEKAEAARDLISFVAQTRGVEAGEAELRARVEANPESYSLSIALADLLVQQRKADEARTILERVIESAPEDQALAAKAALARNLATQGEAEEARRIVAEMLEADSRNIDALTLQAGFDAQDGKLDDAVTNLRTALGQQPDAVNVMLPLATIHERRGALELAEDRFAAAANAGNFTPVAARPYVDFLLRHGRTEQAERVLGQILERQTGHMPSLALMAQLRLARRDWQGAQEIADRIVEIDSDSTTAKQISGAVLAGQEKFDESIEVLQEVIASAPNHSQPLVSLIQTYVRAGRREEAEQTLKATIANEPNRADARILLAAIHEDSGAIDNARATLTEAIEVAPSPVAFRALAAFDLRQEGRPAAIATIGKGLESFPSDPNLIMYSATLNEQDGKIDAAIADYERLIEISPGNVIAANNLASLMVEYRDDEASLERASALAERLRSFDIPQFKDTIAWVHYRKGQYAPAIGLLLEAIAAPSPLPVYHYHLGMAYLADGDNARAREQFAAAIELGKTRPFADAEKAAKELKALEEKATAN